MTVKPRAMPPTKWTFESRRSGLRRTIPLALYWEVACDPISDEWTPDEISPDELWSRWIADISPSYPAYAVPIYWYVTEDRRDGPGGVFESAPYLDSIRGDFLAYFTYPVNARTGDRVRWTALPVVDKRWRAGRADKGGFIQELTGWKPSPFQATVDLTVLARAAGVAAPSEYRVVMLP